MLKVKLAKEVILFLHYRLTSFLKIVNIFCFCDYSKYIFLLLNVIIDAKKVDTPAKILIIVVKPDRNNTVRVFLLLSKNSCKIKSKDDIKIEFRKM